MEIIIDLMQMTMSNLLESQGMEAPSDLDSGKWYKKIQKNY
jgi:hypothetical protein